MLAMSDAFAASDHPPMQDHPDPVADYHEVIITDSSLEQHRYPMASAPAEDAEHSLDFVDGEGNPVHWEAGTWDGWTLSNVPI